RYALQQIRSHHLVAGFHIGEIQIADEVAQKGEQLVSKRVAEEKSPLVPTSHEPGAKNSVRILGEKHLQHPQKIVGMVLKVGVMDYDEFGIHMQQPSPNGRPFSAVFFVAHPDPGDLVQPALRFNRLAKALEASCVRSDEPSSTTMILTRSKSGESARINSRAKLASTRNCSL